MTFETILFFLLLVDSLGAVLAAWFGKTWWTAHGGVAAAYFPPAKGWTMLYLALVLYIGYLSGVYHL